MRDRMAVVVGFLLVAAPALAQDIEHKRIKLAREALINSAAATQPQADTAAQNDSRYQVDIGIYGRYEPSIDPNVAWLWIACFSTPGVSYPGFSLMWVDVLVGHTGGAWYSGGFPQGVNNDRGVCDINKGVDTTFIEIPRHLEVTYWVPNITADEQIKKNVIGGIQVFYPVHTYR